MKKVFVRISIMMAVFFFCSAWGFLVHRTINQLAIYKLPKPLRSFFYTYMDSVVRNAPRPDMRRSNDPSEGSRHFIDLEAFGDSAAWRMPLKWADAIKQYTRDTMMKYGYVPYHVIAIKNKLTESFRSRNKDSILFYATDLGHYIGDASVPLHTSLNYDGQLTNQRGIHDLWETSVPEALIDHYRLYSRSDAKYLSNPEEEIWNSVRQAHSLLKEMLDAEREVSKNFTDSAKYFMQFRWGRERRFYTPAFAKAFDKQLGNSINEQLLRSASTIANFWYTAWVDAGEPDLSALQSGSFGKQEKKDLKKQCKAYRKNELIEKNLLIARQITEN